MIKIEHWYTKEESYSINEVCEEFRISYSIIKSCKILTVNLKLRKKRALEIIVFLIIIDIKKAKEPGDFS